MILGKDYVIIKQKKNTNMTKPRLFIVWLTFIYLILDLSLVLAQREVPELVKKVKPAVVLIYTYDSNGKLVGQGSGFFVNAEGEVITNYHLLYGVNRGEVKTAQGMSYLIKGVIGQDIEGDLVKVVLDTSDKTFPYLQVRASLPEEGEKVVVIGNPLGLEQTVSDGIVSAVRDSPPFGKIIQITAPISPGSSGSPVVNMAGEVIGVATLQFSEGQSLNFAIPGKRIVNLKPMEVTSLLVWNLLREAEEWLKSREIDTLSELTTGIESKELKSAEELLLSGGHLAGKGDWEGTLPYFREAVKKKPDYGVDYLLLGEAYFELGRYTEAIEPFKEAIRLKPDNAAAHCRLGLAYWSSGRDMLAIESFKQAISIQPDYAEAYNWLGCVYSKVGRYTEAIEAFKEAIRIKPDYAEAHYNLGVNYGNLGRHMEAIEALKMAIRIQPDYALAHFNLGLGYLILSDKASALDEYKILKTLDPALANKLFNLIYK